MSLVSGPRTYNCTMTTKPAKLRLVTGVRQLPVRPVGPGATRMVDPCIAPLVMLAVTVGTTATIVAAHVMVDESPLFQMIGSVPLASGWRGGTTST